MNYKKIECNHVHKDAPYGAVCEDCGKPWNSEYHMSDKCVNIDEDIYGERQEEFCN